MARLVAAALPATLGQNVFVENKPGAGNTLGSRIAAEAAPDGYTLMVSAASGLIISPMIYQNRRLRRVELRADRADRGDAAVAGDQCPAAVQIASPTSSPMPRPIPASSIIRPAASARIPHLAAELFKKTTGTDIVHVPYKGGGPALTGVIAGEVQMTFDPVATSLPLDQGRQVARAGDRRTEARRRAARRADHGRKRLSRRSPSAPGPRCWRPRPRRPRSSPSSMPRVNKALNPSR